MSETDSVRLARIEEKFDALADKLDERHEGVARRLECAETDLRSLKDDRAKVVGGAAALGFAAGAVGSVILKLFGTTK
ncbi:hypothetical protein JCM15519_16890 [Fundidesulfovibrio butyratiphilus]